MWDSPTLRRKSVPREQRCASNAFRHERIVCRALTGSITERILPSAMFDGTEIAAGPIWRLAHSAPRLESLPSNDRSPSQDASYHFLPISRSL